MSLVQLEEPGGRSANPARARTLLLVTMVRLRNGPRGLQLDDQTCAGLVRWAEHFERVVYCGLLSGEDDADESTSTWVDVASLPGYDRMRVVPLPFAYRIGTFLRTYKATRRILADEIRKADSLCFTIGYVFGDWGGVAALEAIRQGRKYATWFDRVEHDVLRNTLHSFRFRRRVKEQMLLPLMKPYHFYLVRRSSLGLFQGMDTFNAYAAHSSNPACVYDVHTHPDDFISAEQSERKAAEVEAGTPLRVLYVGRAAAMKGPEDWLDVVYRAVQAGGNIKARWLGDGPLLERMRSLVSERGLERHVELVGHVGDRQVVLAALRDSHLFLFCHKTAESPRCLIEALVSGCPIVGYGSHYSAGLVEQDGGGAFSPSADVAQLASLVVDLARDRRRLADLIRASAKSGRRFDEGKLYGERAELIAAYA